MKKVKYNTLNTIAFLIKEIKKQDKALFFYFIVYTLCSAVTPVLTMFILPVTIEEITVGTDINTIILTIVSVFSVSTILSLISSTCYKVYWPRVIKVRNNMMMEMLNKVMRADYIKTESKEYQDTVRKANYALSNNEVGVEGILNQLFYSISGILTFACYAAILSVFNVWVLCFLIFTVVGEYFFSYYIYKKNHDLQLQMAPYSRKTSYLDERMQLPGLGKDVRLYNMKDWMKKCYWDAIASKMQIFKEIQNNGFSLSAFKGLASVLRDGGVYVYLIYQVINGGLSISELTLYFTVVSTFSSSLTSVLSAAANVRNQNLYVNDYREFMESEENDVDEAISEFNTVPSVDEAVSIEFKNVSFRYPNSDINILEKVNFKIEKGQHIALVGENGAGKTTLVKLICRFYEPTEGTILINSTDYRTFKVNEYYKLISAVFQDVDLFSFSIAENIAMCSDKKVDYTKIKRIIRSVGLNKKIESQRKGIYAQTLKKFDSNGTEFSGGEMQKMFLARAMYKDASVMILDEPTAAMDALAESKLYEDFSNITKKKTAVYISHRLASTKFCDKIFYLSDKKILESGTHDELIALGGKYAEMFTSQSKYYFDGFKSEGV